MAFDVIVPPLSQTMDTVVLVQWLKAVGDPVRKGEPLFVIETDKANLEIEAPASGILQKVLVQPGAQMPVRSTIAVIAEEGEEPPHAAPQPVSSEPTVTAATEPSHPAAATSVPAERAGRLFASPRARRLAEQEGVALNQVKPTGPQQMIVERDIQAYLAQRQAAPKLTPVARRLAQDAGLDVAQLAPAHPGARITRADVEGALAARHGAAAAIRWLEPSPTRQTIARRMSASQQAAAEVTLTRLADATDFVQLRERILAELREGDPRPTYTDLLVNIVALQLKKHPFLNATIDEQGRIGLYEGVHIAVAVDTERGLVAPVVRDADAKGLLELSRERSGLTQRAIAGQSTPDELTGGTFTITNLGPLDVDAFTPIINQPQAAILGVGRIYAGPAVHEGQLCARQLMMLSLTFDHRIVDGAPAARFLRDVVRLIERPHLRWL